MGHCGVSSLPSLGLHHMRYSLRVLFLQDNDLTKVEGLDTLANLQELVLDRNKIKFLDVNSLTGLVHLQARGAMPLTPWSFLALTPSLPPPLPALLLSRTALKKLRIGTVVDFGWEVAHAAVPPRPPVIPRTVARTEGYTYAGKVVSRSRAIFCPTPAGNPQDCSPYRGIHVRR
jgi:hypothetical protein